MKARFTILFFFTLIGFSQTLFSQTPYRSNGSGAWTDNTKWQIFNGSTWVTASTSPSSIDGTITIRSGDSLGLTVATTIDEVQIDAGGVLALFKSGGPATTFTLNDGPGNDINVDGRLWVSQFATLSGGGSIQSGSGSQVVVNGAGILAVTTTIGAGGELVLNNSDIRATVTSNGTITWPANNIALNNGTIINNGNFNATGNNLISNGTGINLVTNNGTFTKSLGAGSTFFSVPFTNTGTININTGTLQMFGGTGTAPLFNNNGGTLNFSGTNFTNSSGTVNLNAGTVINGTVNYTSAGSATTSINEAVSLTNVTFNAGTINGSGTLTIPGTFAWSSNGALGVSTVLPVGATTNITVALTKSLAASLVNNGTINWVAGNISLNNGTLTNNGTLREQFTNNYSFLNGGGVNSIVNTGLIDKTTTFTLTNLSSVPITNSGTIQGTGMYAFTSGLTTSAGAVYSPGSSGSTAVLTAGNQVISPNGTISIQIGSSNTPGSGYDQLAINTAGVNNLSGNLVVTQLPGTPAPLGTYTIMTTTGSFAGSFSSVTLPTNYNYVGIVGGNSIQIQKTALFPLPVKWGGFSAVVNGQQVDLSWTTLEEINTSYFQVEHSTNGQQYDVIATVNAKGNSTSVSQYKFTHYQPDFSQKNYYRIKQVDIDGKSSYSAVNYVSFKNGKVIPVQVGSNPFRSVLNLSVQEKGISIQLINASGIVLKKIELQPGAAAINLNEIPAGIYFMSIYQDGQYIETKRIVKE